MHDRRQHGGGRLDVRPDARPKLGRTVRCGFRTRAVGRAIGLAVCVGRAIRDAGSFGIAGRLRVCCCAVGVAGRLTRAGGVRVAGTVQLVEEATGCDSLPPRVSGLVYVLDIGGELVAS
jgi:hypothetical protein